MYKYTPWTQKIQPQLPHPNEMILLPYCIQHGPTLSPIQTALSSFSRSSYNNKCLVTWCQVIPHQTIIISTQSIRQRQKEVGETHSADETYISATESLLHQPSSPSPQYLHQTLTIHFLSIQLTDS